MPHDDAPDYLSHMSLAQLRQFAANLQGLAAAGDALVDARFDPVFDLRPGLPVSIHLDFDMPLASRAPDTDLTRHLSAVPYRGKWTANDDLTLFDLLCTGMQPDAIAAEMDIGREDVIVRFDLLTGLDRETKKRRFTRSTVLDALILQDAGRA